MVVTLLRRELVSLIGLCNLVEEFRNGNALIPETAQVKKINAPDEAITISKKGSDAKDSQTQGDLFNPPAE